MAPWGCARIPAHVAVRVLAMSALRSFYVFCCSRVRSGVSSLLRFVSPPFVMDAAAVAALAAAVDHVQAAALSELLLERERLATQAEDLRRLVAQLRGAAAWALRDLRQGDVEMAEQRLVDVVEMVDSDDD